MSSEVPECPLCLEELEIDDINFFPCSCGYQICRFCWNRIRTVGNGLCPACRREFSESPADFKPLSSQEFSQARRKNKDQNRKLKTVEVRSKMANSDTRVVQTNLVFVSGIPLRIADPELLKRPEYFGKFGKIQRIIINQATDTPSVTSRSQAASATAYVTFVRAEDALNAIQSVTNTWLEGRTLKATVGTTKYCNHFLKNKKCPKNDCMYLHEIADEKSSFTKEDMKEGKHIEFARSLLREIMLRQKSAEPPRCPSPPPPPPPPQNDSHTEEVNLNTSVVEREFEVRNKEDEDSEGDEDEADLDFDPFHETQKGLAELLQSEAAEEEWSGLNQEIQPSSNLPPPPPGFEHQASSSHQLDRIFNSNERASPQFTSNFYQNQNRLLSNTTHIRNLNCYNGISNGLQTLPVHPERNWQNSLHVDGEHTRRPYHDEIPWSARPPQGLLPGPTTEGRLRDRFAEALAVSAHTNHQHSLPLGSNWNYQF